jgi:exosortase
MFIGTAVRCSLLARFEQSAYLPLAVIAVIAASVWPVWRWITMRATHDASDAWALLSLAMALLVLWRDRPSELSSPAGERHTDVRLAGDVRWTAHVRWTVPLLLMTAYVASYPFAPPLVRAVLAMSAIAAACSAVWYRRVMDLRIWGLLLLSLPLIPSLNFYLGYPLRVVVTEATVVLLRMNGFSALRDGASILWNNQHISVDAPCSGIKMLWTGLFLSCALAALMRLDTQRTLLLLALATAVVLTANVLRATALFYVESGLLIQARPAHDLIGVFAFVFAALLIAGMAVRLRVVAHAS